MAQSAGYFDEEHQRVPSQDHKEVEEIDPVENSYIATELDSVTDTCSKLHRTSDTCKAVDDSWIKISISEQECGQSINRPGCYITSNADCSSDLFTSTQPSVSELTLSGLPALLPFTISTSSGSMGTVEDPEQTIEKELVSTEATEEETHAADSSSVMSPSDLRCSFTSLSGSVGRLSSVPDYFCDECQLIEESLPSRESLEFWKKVPCKGLDETRCHKKFMEKFLDVLKLDPGTEQLLADSKTTNILKMLLKVDPADELAVVEFKDFARLVKYFGPVKPDNCVLLQQIRSIKEASKPSGKRNQQKVNWFAGDISRKVAEQYLDKHLDGTYLVRMSQSERGAFVISVVNNTDVEHVKIKGDYTAALTTEPYDARLHLNDKTYPSLVAAITSLQICPLTIKVDEGDEEAYDIYCKICCPGLPLNAIVSGYKRTSNHRRN